MAGLPSVVDLRLLQGPLPGGHTGGTPGATESAPSGVLPGGTERDLVNWTREQLEEGRAYDLEREREEIEEAKRNLFLSLKNAQSSAEKRECAAAKYKRLADIYRSYADAKRQKIMSKAAAIEVLENELVVRQLWKAYHELLTLSGRRPSIANALREIEGQPPLPPAATLMRRPSQSGSESSVLSMPPDVADTKATAAMFELDIHTVQVPAVIPLPDSISKKRMISMKWQFLDGLEMPNVRPGATDTLHFKADPTAAQKSVTIKFPTERLMPGHAGKVADLVRYNKKALMRHLGVLDGTIDAVVDEDGDSCSMTVNVPASVDVELAMIHCIETASEWGRWG